MKPRIRPATLTDAIAFVRAHHRHSRKPQGGLFATSLAAVETSTNEPYRTETVVGVAIAGRTVAPGWSPDVVEVTRCCTLGTNNACSMLYGAICGAAQRLGYARAITYTRCDEPGVSLRAAGFLCFAFIPAREWSREKRLRARDPGIADRFRWERAL